MAKEYPFKLDTFQEISIACLVRKPGMVQNAAVTTGHLSRFFPWRRNAKSPSWYLRTPQLERQQLQSEQHPHLCIESLYLTKQCRNN